MQNRKYGRGRETFEPADETNLIEGRHAVSEALRSGRTIDKLYMLYGSNDSALTALKARAAALGIGINECDRQRLDAMSTTGAHQGVIAVAAAHEYAELADILCAAREAGEAPLLVVCDGINDPHNLGAIIRSAGAAGAHGVIIPKHRSVGLTATVAKAAAGALEYVPVARVPNMTAALKGIEGAGRVGLRHLGQRQRRALRDGPDRARRYRDRFRGGWDVPPRERDLRFCHVDPHAGKIASLNASNAAAVVLFEAVRQRSFRSRREGCPVQDDKKNIPENDELEDIKMLLGDDDSAPEDADALLDDILKEYEVDGAGKDADPDSLLAELENLTAQFSEDAAVIGETAGEASLAAQEEASEIVEAEHAPDAAAAGEGPAEGTVRVEEVPMDPPRKVSAAQRRKAARRSDELQNEIARQVDAAMDERRENSGKLPKLGKKTGEAYTAAPDPQPVYENENPAAEGGGRISDDLRAFREIAPDEAAAKAKRAVGYYSWRCTITAILAVLAWYITAAPTYTWWLPSFISYIELPYIYLLILCILQVFAMLMGVSLLADGLRNAVKLNFKSETLIALSSVVSLLYTMSIMAMPSGVGYLPFTPVVILGMFIGLFTRRQRYKSIRWSCRAARRTEGTVPSRGCAITRATCVPSIKRRRIPSTITL